MTLYYLQYVVHLYYKGHPISEDIDLCVWVWVIVVHLKQEFSGCIGSFNRVTCAVHK